MKASFPTWKYPNSVRVDTETRHEVWYNAAGACFQVCHWFLHHPVQIWVRHEYTWLTEFLSGGQSISPVQVVEYPKERLFSWTAQLNEIVLYWKPQGQTSGCTRPKVLVVPCPIYSPCEQEPRASRCWYLPKASSTLFFPGPKVLTSYR